MDWPQLPAVASKHRQQSNALKHLSKTYPATQAALTALEREGSATIKIIESKEEGPSVKITLKDFDQELRIYLPTELRGKSSMLKEKTRKKIFPMAWLKR